MFEDIIKNHADMVKAITKQKLVGNMSIQFSFDRKRPTIKIYDNAACIELTFEELAVLKKFIPDQ